MANMADRDLDYEFQLLRATGGSISDFRTILDGHSASEFDCVMTVKVDTRQEVQYLTQLAQALGLDQQTLDAIHQQVN